MLVRPCSQLRNFQLSGVEKNLFAEALRVADFILNLPGCLFGDTLAFQVGIVRHVASLFPDLAFTS
jgi:hypothetical protein